MNISRKKKKKRKFISKAAHITGHRYLWDSQSCFAQAWEEWKGSGPCWRDQGVRKFVIHHHRGGVSWLCFLPGCQLLSIQHRAVRYRYVWLEYLGCKVHLHGKAQC